MALSHMAAKDEDALVCDFAQFYGITDYRALSLTRAAVLAVGLPEEARIKRLLNNIRFDIKTMLLAFVVDYLAIDVWFQTKDGHLGRNRPKSMVSILNTSPKDEEEEGNKEHMAFASAEEFEAERQRILKEITDGGRLQPGESIRPNNSDHKRSKRKPRKHTGRGRRPGRPGGR